MKLPQFLSLRQGPVAVEDQFVLQLCQAQSMSGVVQDHRKEMKQWAGWWYTYPSEKYESQLG